MAALGKLLKGGAGRIRAYQGLKQGPTANCTRIVRLTAGYGVLSADSYNQNSLLLLTHNILKLLMTDARVRKSLKIAADYPSRR